MLNSPLVEIPLARFITLDSSMVGHVAHDYFSSDVSRRKTATKFLNNLTDSGFVPFLCWHRFEELLRHQDHKVVSDRMDFLRLLPHVAWISITEGEGLGSILDMLILESRVVLDNPELSVKGVRDQVRNTLISFGTGEQAVEPYKEIWPELRPYLWEREARAREIVAISKTKAADISQGKAANIINGRVRPESEAQKTLQHLQVLMANEIRSRGDKRIPNANTVASDYFCEIEREGRSFYAGQEHPILDYLQQIGVDPHEIHSKMSIGELTELAEFRSKLRVAHRQIGGTWEELKRVVTPDKVPSWIVESSLKKYGQDQPERKGSELNDRFLACLSLYTDLTYVDKRTKEDFRRVFQKDANLQSLVHRIEKVRPYQRVYQHISDLDF